MNKKDNILYQDLYIYGEKDYIKPPTGYPDYLYLGQKCHFDTNYFKSNLVYPGYNQFYLEDKEGRVKVLIYECYYILTFPETPTYDGWVQSQSMITDQIYDDYRDQNLSHKLDFPRTMFDDCLEEQSLKDL